MNKTLFKTETTQCLTQTNFVGPDWRLLAALVGLLLLSGVGKLQAQENVPNSTVPGSSAFLYLPVLTGDPLPICPPSSTRSYDLIPVDGPAADHPDALHGDLNLALRGYTPVSETLGIVDINGPTDGDAPQLAGIFSDARTPAFSSAHRVYAWDWGCGEHGCPSANLTPGAVSLLGLAGSRNETVASPGRGPEIYGGGYKVLVLYAAADRITLGYTRHDSVAPGYAVHLESVCVDPNLLALYEQANADGRTHLPALRDGEVLGTLQTEEMLVAVRDRGTFMDPRSRKDWWKGR
ncbi:MAG: hypothetical protein KF753_00480 [Caldilineaceae bacterium]|nr:hypothetical protein [Caldilineaceae bacterium]